MNDKCTNWDEAALIKKGESYYHSKNYKKCMAIFARAQRIYPNGKVAYYAFGKDE